MATEQQEHLKIEQLREHSADEIEVIAGREKENLEGWIPELATDAEIREALEKAFDYRGDITITRKDGSQGRGLSLRSALRHVARRLVRSHHSRQGADQVNVSYADIAALAFYAAAIRLRARPSRPG